MLHNKVPIMRHPKAGGLDHIMLMLTGGDGMFMRDATTDRARDGAAGVLSCLAICEDLPDGYGTKWRAESIKPLFQALQASKSHKSRLLTRQ